MVLTNDKNCGVILVFYRRRLLRWTDFHRSVPEHLSPGHGKVLRQGRRAGICRLPRGRPLGGCEWQRLKCDRSRTALRGSLRMQTIRKKRRPDFQPPCTMQPTRPKPKPQRRKSDFLSRQAVLMGREHLETKEDCDRFLDRSEASLATLTRKRRIFTTGSVAAQRKKRDVR